MMNKNTLFLAEQIWGAGASYREGYCVCHGEAQARSSFRDEVSWAEFRISSLCQSEQDAIFGVDEDEEVL
jgi:hypothetical protein